MLALARRLHPAIMAVCLSVAASCGSDSLTDPGPASSPEAGLQARPGGAQGFLRIGPAAVLDDGAVILNVRFGCPADAVLLEAFVQVSQEEAFAFGDAGIPVQACEGRTRHFRIRVQPLEGAFTRGEAFASGFGLFEFPNGETDQAQQSRSVRVRGSS